MDLSSSHISLRSRSYTECFFTRMLSPMLALPICRVSLACCRLLNSFFSIFKPTEYGQFVVGDSKQSAWISQRKRTALKDSSSQIKKKEDDSKLFFNTWKVVCIPRKRDRRSVLGLLSIWFLTRRRLQKRVLFSSSFFFFNRKLVMSFSEAGRMELDSTTSSARKLDFWQGSFREGQGFEFSSMVIFKFVMNSMKT